MRIPIAVPVPGSSHAAGTGMGAAPGWAELPEPSLTSQDMLEMDFLPSLVLS